MAEPGIRSSRVAAHAFTRSKEIHERLQPQGRRSIRALQQSVAEAATTMEKEAPSCSIIDDEVVRRCASIPPKLCGSLRKKLTHLADYMGSITACSECWVFLATG